eukprot:2891704-Rhodomonas_salina.2
MRAMGVDFAGDGRGRCGMHGTDSACGCTQSACDSESRPRGRGGRRPPKSPHVMSGAGIASF